MAEVQASDWQPVKAAPPADGDWAPVSAPQLNPIDYDYAAAKTAGVVPDERGHMPDTYKLPNHITFSDESVYSGKNGEEGGKWKHIEGEHWEFTPGPSNLKYHTIQELQEYFKREEPDSKLVTPKTEQASSQTTTPSPMDFAEQPLNVGFSLATGFLRNIVQANKGMFDLFITPGTAFQKGITPEKEIEFGANMALMDAMGKVMGGTEANQFIKPRPELTKAIAPAIKEFQDTVIQPGITKAIDETLAKPTEPTPEGATAPHPLQALYDHLKEIDDAKSLGVISERTDPEPTFKDSPSALAEQAVPQPANAAVTPDEMRGRFGHEPGAYDLRGKEWIDKIDAPDDVRDAIEKIASDHDYFPEARAGVASPASRAAVAEAAGIDAADLNSEHFSTNFDSDGKVRAVIQALRQTTKDFMDASEAARKDPSPENAANAVEAQMRHTHVLEYTLGMRAESGRTLNAWKDLLRETERGKAAVKLKAGEAAGETPVGASDIVSAAGEVQSNLKNGKSKVGLQKLIDSAQGLVESHETSKRAPVELSPELKGLTDEAAGVLKSLKGGGEKTPAQFQRLIDTAEKLVGATERHSPTGAPLSPELQGLVDEAKKTTADLKSGAKPPAAFQKLIDTAEKLVGAVKKPQAPKAELPPELAGLVDEAKNTLRSFGKDQGPELGDFKRELEHLSNGTGKLDSTVEAAKALLAKEAEKKAAKEVGVAPKVASERGKLMGAAKRMVAAADKIAPEGKVPPSPEMAALMETARQAVGRIKQANLRGEFEAFRNALNSGDAKAAANAANALLDAEGKAKSEGRPKPPVEYDQAMSAARRVAKAGEEAKAKGLDALPPDLRSLIDEAKNAASELGKKEKSELEKMVDAAEKQAVNMTKQKIVKNPVEALPPELQALVDKSERIVDRFGGVAKGEKAALLLARTGRTAAEQEQLARSVADLTPNQVASVLNKLRTSPEAKQPGWFYWLWQQGLISGLFTHAKYLAVNTATVALERSISPTLAALIGNVRGEKVSAMAPIYANVAMIRSLPDAFEAAGTAFKSGLRVPLQSEMRLFERGEESPQAKGAASAYGQTVGPEWGIWKKVFNEDQLESAAKVLGIPGRSANMIHTFYKVLSERASAATRAYETAFQEGGKPETFWDRYQHHLDNPTDTALRGAVNDAYSGAFMSKLGEKTSAWASALKNNPVTKWVFPFQHIPWNIERMSIEYSPLAVLGPEMRSAILGKKGAPAQNLAIAKMAVGSSVIGYFVHKALAGEATADYPTDPKERKDWQLNNTQANSIKMNDEWVSFERLGPLGNIVHIGAGLGSIIKHYNGQDDDALTSAIWAGSMLAVNQVGNEVGFQTLRNFIDAIENPKKAQRFVAWQAGSLMPFSSFISQQASFQDPYMRKADDLISGLKYRVPFLRETLPPKRDPLYGDPVPNPGYHNVFRSAPVQSDLAKTEMQRLDYHPAAPVNKVGNVKLQPELYDEYQATAGPLVKRLMDAYTQSPGYSQLPDAVKGQEFRALVAMGRGQARMAFLAHHQEIIQQGLEARKTAIFGKP